MRAEAPPPGSPASPRPGSPPGPACAPTAAPRPRSGSTSSSDGSSTPRHSDGGDAASPSAHGAAILAFRSVDLSGALDGSGYCPQSEPVKRKVYAGSATLGRLQKSLEKSQHHSLRLKAEADLSPEDRGGAGSLQLKLAELRRERLQVEAKVREAREEERRRLDERAQAQRQLTLLRRQMLVHTIEGLKRSLEDQSARLHEAVYDSAADSPVPAPPAAALAEP
ncbi:Uncharacterized protein GBIM_03369 [Gryllus bimaculatus]|nr:Uncharacterized protein GBIM_03369 [Gryllus bimaculatus]